MNIKTVLSAVGILCGLMPAAEGWARGQAGELVVMTYNVNYGMSGARDIVELIADSGADVVLLQETNERWKRALEKRLSQIYPHRQYRHAGWAGGLAVLSRYPFESREHVRARGAPFPAWRVIVDTPLGKIQAFNMHLRPTRRGRDGWIKSYLAVQDERLKETRSYLEHVDPDMPVIMAGDFNEDAGGKSMVHLGEQGLENALTQFVPFAVTWRWKTDLGEVKWQLDHILYRGLRAVGAQVLDRGSSDHFPVLARFAGSAQPS